MSKFGPVLKKECAVPGEDPEEVHKNDPGNEKLDIGGVFEDSGSVLGV